jgi:Fic family protein
MEEHVTDSNDAATGEIHAPQAVTIRYELPDNWIAYDQRAVFQPLLEAKAAVYALTKTPYQREWVERLQEIQLKMEVAGTSRIEGADFTDNELDAALKPEDASASAVMTRSQRQARAAVQTYRWIATLPPDLPIDSSLVKEIHARMVSGCDDDHCAPGQLRGQDYNVTFGVPRHRGCEGGESCKVAFERLIRAVQREFAEHDQLIQALAFHYHFAAMHPFLDGNGRAARALEALMLQRAGLRDTAFIAMSNYYYDEKPSYLTALADVRARDHDLTPFLVFGLKGVSIQCNRLFTEIRRNMQKALFRDTMYQLFNRMRGKKTRVIKDRQLRILNLLLKNDRMDWDSLVQQIRPEYAGLKSWAKAITRDMSNLNRLRAIKIEKVGPENWVIEPRLEWPSEITESAFFSSTKHMPKGKSYKFLP